MNTIPLSREQHTRWYLSGSYFLYYGILGVFVPYLAVFLDYRGFSSIDIGDLLAILTFTKILGPQLWANRADKTGQQLKIIQLGVILSFCCFIFIPWVESFWQLALVLALFSMFWTAILPQLEVLTLISIKKQIGLYSRIRLWGSIGYIVLVMFSGYVLERFSPEVLPWSVLALMVLLWPVLLLLKTPTPVVVQQQDGQSFWHTVANRSFIAFFVSATLLQISFAPFYVFFTLYLQDMGYSGTQTGIYISLGVIAEIGMFLLAGRLLGRFDLKWILFGSLLLTAWRWHATGAYGEVWWLLGLAQLVHAVSFGLTHSASMAYIQQHFRPQQQSRGQALYIGGAFGLGGAVGALVAGHLWENGTGAINTFNFAALGALLAALAIVFIDDNKAVRMKS